MDETMCFTYYTVSTLYYNRSIKNNSNNCDIILRELSNNIQKIYPR